MTTRDDQIRQRAYAIWEREGRPDGRHEEHWQRAVEEIGRELGAGDSEIGPTRASRPRSPSKSSQANPASRRTRRASPTEADATSETPRETRKSRSPAASTASFATQNGSAAGSPAGDAQHTATEPDYSGEALQSAPIALKYRHPESPELTWSGRGRRPAWIRDALEAGRQLADFEIPS
jgi:DNA-binding protein H-NS